MTSEKTSFDWLHEDVVNNSSFSSAFEKEYRKLYDSKPLPRDQRVNPPPAVLEYVSKEFHPYLFGEQLWLDFLKIQGLDDKALELDIKHVIKMLVEGGELQQEAISVIQGEIKNGSILGRAFELTARFETTLVDQWFSTFAKRKHEASASFNQKWRGEDHDLYVAVYGLDLVEARNEYLKKKNLEDPPKVVTEGSGIILQGHFSYEEGKPYVDLRNLGFFVLSGASLEADFPGQLFLINFDELKVPGHLRKPQDKPDVDERREEIPIPKEIDSKNLELEYPMLEKEDSWDSPPNKIKPFVEKQVPGASGMMTRLREYIKPGEQPPPGVPVYQGRRGGHYFFRPPKQSGTTESRGASITLESSRKAAVKFFGEGGDKFLSQAYAVDVPGYSTKIIYAGFESYNVHEDDDLLKVMVNVYDSDNKRVGSLQRKFDKTSGELEANHDEFILEPEHQGKGIAASMTRNSEEAYMNSGIKKVAMVTGKSVGGYAWALQGYDFDPDTTELQLMKKHFSSAIKALAVRENLPKYSHIQKKFPSIDVDQAKKMISDVYNMKHSWEFARYNPFSNKHGEHFGKAMMLGTSWMAQKTLDPKAESYQVGLAYRQAKQKIGAMGG